MFEALSRRGICVDALNVYAGLYTQGQVDELDKRVKELWETVNNANSVLMTYVSTIKQMTDENYSFCGKKWTEEMKKEEILRCCERLHELQEECDKVMFKKKNNS